MAKRKTSTDDAVKKANEAAEKAKAEAAKKKQTETEKAEVAKTEAESVNMEQYIKQLEAKILKLEQSKKEDPKQSTAVKKKGKSKTIGSKELGFHEIVEGEQSASFLYAVIEQEEWVKGTKLSLPILSTYRLGDWLHFLSHGEGQNWTIQGVLHVPTEWGSELPLTYDEFFDAQRAEMERRKEAEERIRKARMGSADKPRERVFMK